MNLRELTNNNQKNINITFRESFKIFNATATQLYFQRVLHFIILKTKKDLNNIQLYQNNWLEGICVNDNEKCTNILPHSENKANVHFEHLVKYKGVLAHFDTMKIILNKKTCEYIDIDFDVKNYIDKTISVEYMYNDKLYIEEVYNQDNYAETLKFMTRNIMINDILS